MFFGTLISSIRGDRRMQENVASSGNNMVSAYETAKALLQDERNYNSLEAQKNREWQEYMSNTAYTRAVSDMRNAGLNPYLAYSQGGAPVGSGATASHGGLSNTAFSALVNGINNVLDNQTSNLNTILKNITARENNQMSNLTKLTTTAMNNATSSKNTALSLSSKNK